MTFQDLVTMAAARGGLPPDDVLGLLGPVFGAVAELHEHGMVAPLRGLRALTWDGEGPAGLDVSGAGLPQTRAAAVAALERPASAALDVRRVGVVETRYDTAGDLGTGEPPPTREHEPEGMRIVAGWQRWEHLLGHHDQLTDIASLGELAVALTFGLDLADPDDAASLDRAHSHLLALDPHEHPVFAAVLAEMIAPDRRRRAQDLDDVFRRLVAYRDQPEDFDLDRVLAQASTDTRGGVRERVLTHLRDRLFDVSRRNPLLYFRPTQRTLNLTEASVPLVLDVANVRPEHLFTWGGPVAKRLIKGSTVDVGTMVRWDDAPYASASLDALVSGARRDRFEYGRDQLRLIVAFLRWHNLKQDPGQRIGSPLVLASVALTKRRGVRDAYRLQLLDTVAEVNPVLRHHLREVYGFALPETVDLADEAAMQSLRLTIETQARATQPAVSVALVERPRIDIVRHRAQVRLQAHRRRTARSTARGARRRYAYSYQWPGWNPLGLAIFRDRVLRTPIPLSTELGDAPVPRYGIRPEPAFGTPPAPATPPGPVVETDLYTLGGSDEANPYAWEVDLCSVTLANLNYRTLSLVNDYEALLDAPVANACFEELFSTAPRRIEAPHPAPTVAERHLVVPADGSQIAAIASARAGGNLVIQGPPGTGKSQTITNLIADCLASGRRVLFVCQKRAALDVVHARLRAAGLGEVCTLVHDSQQDKKEFVHGLKATYESWIALGDPGDAADARRAELVAELETCLAEIAGFEAAVTSPASGAGAPSLLDVVDRLVALHEARWGDDLPPAHRRLLPVAGAWWTARPAVSALAAALVRAAEPPILARTAVRLLDPRLWDEPRTDALVAEHAQAATAALDAARALLEPIGGAAATGALTVHGLADVLDAADVLGPPAARGHVDLLKPRSGDSARLRADASAARDAEVALTKARAAAAGWHHPPEQAQAEAALAVATDKETSFLKFLSGSWRQTKALVAQGFTAGDGRHAPTVTHALQRLVDRYRAEYAWQEVRRRSDDEWGHPDPGALRRRVEELRGWSGERAAWRDAIATLDSDDPLTALPAAAARLSDSLALLGSHAADEPWDALRPALAVLASAAGGAIVRAVGPVIREPALAPVLPALRVLDAGVDEIEYAVGAAALADAGAAFPVLERLDGERLADLVARARAALTGLQTVNADVIVARLRRRFVDAVDVSQRSVTGMSSEQRALKKTWSQGRRELEHEFTKVRAYKSVRQLTSGAAGAVVAAMRPVWLMSPSSLSDTLPIDPAEPVFDVVVFDEASQVPVEQAVPALFRGRQLLVVGDRMQLPPTQYFRVRGADAAGTSTGADADRDDPDDDDLPVGVALTSDSLLAVASERLPSTMLTWHYRSRHEALIQFSNAAFYEGRLATIPDRGRTSPQAELAFDAGDSPEPQDVAAAVDGLLERSISFLRMRDAVYEKRVNPGEAEWIAHLIRELLARGTGLSLGVVAFSEAQQGEIERALERLSSADPEFAARYEQELQREDDGQATGLFVKNLENVQGDERDIILMSVCYAPGPDGRMRMNFGPINNPGGEKRLNVIFSRARFHMVVVSTIDHTAVTNTYNDGANTLRGFLRYAQAVSAGDVDGAQAALTGLGHPAATPTAEPAVVSRLAARLRELGLVVVERLGQSGFRCDLAVGRPGAQELDVAVLVDRAADLRGHPVDERRIVRPDALASAGWRVVQVVATQWVDDPQSVVDEIVAALRPAD